METLSQFGLYRYKSTDSKKSKYRQISFIIYGIFGFASIVIFATFFIIIVQSNLQDKSIVVINPKQPSLNNSYNVTTVLTQNDDTIIRDEQLELLHTDDEHEFLIADNINDTVSYDDDREARNGTIDDFDEYDPSSSGDSETVEDLEQISAEKLTLPENDYRHIPPRPRRKKKRHPIGNRRQFDTRVTYYEPRPFDFELNGPPPASFQKHNFTNPGMTTYTIPASQFKANSIQDILNQGEIMSDGPNDKTVEINRIQFAGKYRHPKRYNELMGIFSQKYPRTPIPQPTMYPTMDYFPSSSTQFSSDPFYKYKPRTPSEINLMALNQFRFAPYGPKLPLTSSSSSIVPSTAPMRTLSFQPSMYSQFTPTKYLYPINPPPSSHLPSEYENIYHALLKSNHANSGISSSSGSSSSSSSEKRVDGRSRKAKPFSLMLDIYPMTDDDSIISGLTSTKRPSYRLRRPIQQLQPPIYPPGFINQYNPAAGDHSYFNSINFPQLQQQRYPTMNNNQYNSHYFQTKLRNSNNNNNFNQNDDADGGYEKPGQMVVHLNLFPKGNRNRNNKHKNLEYLEDRTSEEADASNYDGSYDFQPRSLNSDKIAEISSAEITLNTGELLTTSSPPSLNISKNFEIIRSIELNATDRIHFDNIALDQNQTVNLVTHPIVVIPNSENHGKIRINRNDDYDNTEIEFMDYELPAIPKNHKIDNCTRDMSTALSNFTIDHAELMRFEPKDVVIKQSERDYFAERI